MRMARSADLTARRDCGATVPMRTSRGWRPVDVRRDHSPMSPFTIAVLALSMSIDAFAVSIGRGAAIGSPPLRDALRTGLIFGIVEATTPILGWIAGVAASRFVQAVDHWIAFALLAGVGIHMLYAAIWGSTDNPSKGRSLTALMATAVGTSIDAMAVGISRVSSGQHRHRRGSNRVCHLRDVLGRHACREADRPSPRQASRTDCRSCTLRLGDDDPARPPVTNVKRRLRSWPRNSFAASLSKGSCDI